MIKIDVDMNKCQHYGQCVFEAPEVFQLNADDKLEYGRDGYTNIEAYLNGLIDGFDQYFA